MRTKARPRNFPTLPAPGAAIFRVVNIVLVLEGSYVSSIGFNRKTHDTCGNTWKVTDLLAIQADLAEMVLRPLWRGDACAHAVFDYPWYYDRLLCVAAACVDG
ncbi:MAG: hypothetical protein ACP5QA_06210 [Phycisphaerae bacterium]